MEKKKRIRREGNTSEVTEKEGEVSEEQEKIECDTCEFLVQVDKYNPEYYCARGNKRRINPSIVDRDNTDRDNKPEWCPEYMDYLVNIAMQKKGLR